MSITSKFGVIIWIRHDNSFDKLWSELCTAANKDPEEDTECDHGRVFVHWDCDSLEAAQAILRSLKKFSVRPEIVFMRLADYTKEEGSVTYKDTRFAGE